MNREFLDFGNVNSELEKVLRGVGARKSCSLFGVTESLKVMMTSSFDMPVVYVTSDIVHARKLQEMFEDIFKDQTVIFPAVADNLIYKKAVSAEGFLERNRALSKILQGKARIVIASTDALMMPLAPVKEFEASTISLKKGH